MKFWPLLQNCSKILKFFITRNMGGDSNLNSLSH